MFYLFINVFVYACTIKLHKTDKNENGWEIVSWEQQE